MQRFRKDEKAASFIGYGLAVGLIAVIALAVVQGTGSKVAEIFGGAGNSLIVPQAGEGGYPSNQPPVITVSSLPEGSLGQAYSQALTATDADGPDALTWSVSSGALPSGLSLDAGTGEIAGTPDTVETASFTVEVSDGADTASQALSIEVQGLMASCLEILNTNPSAASGIHQIDINGSATDVYCDMDSAGGGWTMVAAAFEQDPSRNVSGTELGTDWAEGLQADYDPSLVTGKTFAMSESELPAHTQSSFGKHTQAVPIDYFNITYTTGDIPLTTRSGQITGLNFHIHREMNAHYYSADPDEEYRPNTGNHTDNSLTISRTPNPGTDPYSDWTYTSSNRPANRGYAMEGVRTTLSIESYAWTVWVR